MKSIVSHFKAAALVSALMLSGCNYTPLYSSPDGSVSHNAALSNVAVASVTTRQAQQVRNHLIFLLSNGVSPSSPSHEVRLRVSTSNSTSATASGNSVGVTAGTVSVTVSYDIFDQTGKNIVGSGRRVASAGYDRTGQSFANLRVVRDAENRAAKEAAEQVRLAIASHLSNG